jgi:hypothetical protein
MRSDLVEKNMKTITPEYYSVILRVSDNEPVFCPFFLLTMDSAIFAKNEGTRIYCDAFSLTSVSLCKGES